MKNTEFFDFFTKGFFQKDFPNSERYTNIPLAKFIENKVLIASPGLNKDGFKFTTKGEYLFLSYDDKFDNGWKWNMNMTFVAKDTIKKLVTSYKEGVLEIEVIVAGEKKIEVVWKED